VVVHLFLSSHKSPRMTIEIIGYLPSRQINAFGIPTSLFDAGIYLIYVISLLS
jgi:hypothetical protein